MSAQAGLRVWAAVLAAAMVLGACGAESAPGTKAGGEVLPVTLRLGTPENESAPYGPWVREFASRVYALTDGSVEIDIRWEAPGPWRPGGAEHDLAQMVMDGDLDLGLVPVRAWTDFDVPSLTPLMTPFLMDSEELAAQVTTGDLAEDLMADLDRVGVVGLALWPEGVRRPIGFGTTVQTAADFQDLRIKVPRSGLSYALYEAIGADPVDVRLTPSEVSGGDVDAVESWTDSYREFPGPKSYTANVAFYTKVGTLSANEGVFADLAPEQREALLLAGAEAGRVAARDLPGPDDLTAAFCAAGVSIAHAEEVDLAFLESRAQPVVERIVSDPGAAELVARIRSLRSTLSPASPPEPCGDFQPEPTRPFADYLDEPDGNSSPPVFPDGVYRADVPMQALLDKGMPRQPAFHGHGINTLTVSDGEFIWHAEHSVPQTCTGTVPSTEGVLVLQMDDSCDYSGLVVLVAQWTLDGDQMSFQPLVTGAGVEKWELGWGLFFTTGPWTRIE